MLDGIGTSGWMFPAKAGIQEFRHFCQPVIDLDRIYLHKERAPDVTRLGLLLSYICSLGPESYYEAEVSLVILRIQ